MVEAPSQINGKAVVLEGSDVFFTGREIFVGIRKGATNMEGALVITNFLILRTLKNSMHALILRTDILYK